MKIFGFRKLKESIPKSREILYPYEHYTRSAYRIPKMDTFDELDDGNSCEQQLSIREIREMVTVLNQYRFEIKKLN